MTSPATSWPQDESPERTDAHGPANRMPAQPAPAQVPDTAPADEPDPDRSGHRLRVLDGGLADDAPRTRPTAATPAEATDQPTDQPVPPRPPAHLRGRRRPRAGASPTNAVEPLGPMPAPMLRFQPREQDFWLMDDTGYVEPRHRRRPDHGWTPPTR